MVSARLKIARINDTLITQWLKGNRDWVCAKLFDILGTSPESTQIVENIICVLLKCRNPEFVYIPRIMSCPRKPLNEDRTICFIRNKKSCFWSFEFRDYLESIPKVIKSYVKKYCSCYDKCVQDCVYKNCLWSICRGTKQFPFYSKNFNFVVEICQYILYNIYEGIQKELNES